MRFKSRLRRGVLSTSFMLPLAVTMLVIPATAMWYQGLGVDVTVKTGDPHWTITTYKGWQLIRFGTHCHCHFDVCKPLTTISVLPGGHTLQATVNTTVQYSFTRKSHHGCGCDCGCNITLKGKVKYVWVGMIVKNTGTVPLKLNGINVATVGNNRPSRWGATSYFYGPLNGKYGRRVRLCVWKLSSCCTLPGRLMRPVPITLNPGEEAIIWTKITWHCGSGIYTFRLTPEVSLFNSG
ncbi:MAG: hypothetical protein J7L55_04550 [Desulfurococcales archaeon]|nr:hypothetical protein [Desulfurococcales archaeon]